MNLHAVESYSVHLLKARSTAGHGVHSPFMFRFITEVVGGKSDRTILAEVESLRKEMLSDTRTVNVKDLGAGSAVMGRKERSIRRIAAIASIPKREASLLARIARSIELGDIRGQSIDHGTNSIKTDHRADIMTVEGGSTRSDNSVAGNMEESGTRSDNSLTGNMERGGTHPDNSLAGNMEEGNTQGNSPGDSQGKSYVSQIYGNQISGTEEKGGTPDKVAGDRMEAEKVFTVQDTAGDESPGVVSYQFKDYNPGNDPVILELGTSLGISTLALALGAPRRKVISVEGCPELAAIARENLHRHGATNAQVICMEFTEALNHLQERGVRVQLAFIDGNHRGEALTEYVRKIREMGDEMIIMADDIRMNHDMVSAWRLMAGETARPQPGSEVAARRVAGGPTTEQPWPEGAASRLAAESTTQQAMPDGASRRPQADNPGSKAGSAKIAPASLETFRMGILFCLRNLTPGHYRVRY